MSAWPSTSSGLRCLLETGTWLSPTLGGGQEVGAWHSPVFGKTPVAACCEACIQLRGCGLFELRRDGECVTANGTALVTAADGYVARGLVMHLSHDSPPPGRRLRQRRRHRMRASTSGGTRQPLRLPATCSPWQQFSQATMSEVCAELAHPERYVLTECDRPGHVAELAVAQANELFPRGDCASACLYHPLTPTTAGWMFDAAAQCFRPWRASERGATAGEKRPEAENFLVWQATVGRPASAARAHAGDQSLCFEATPSPRRFVP